MGVGARTTRRLVRASARSGHAAPMRTCDGVIRHAAHWCRSAGAHPTAAYQGSGGIDGHTITQARSSPRSRSRTARAIDASARR